MIFVLLKHLVNDIIRLGASMLVPLFPAFWLPATGGGCYRGIRERQRATMSGESLLEAEESFQMGIAFRVPRSPT